MGILWIVIVVLAVLWLVGMVVGLIGPLIHLLLVAAAVMFVYNIVSGRRRTF